MTAPSACVTLGVPNGEAADQQVASPGFVQRPADADDVARLRRSRATIIILVIHASASSNEENR